MTRNTAPEMDFAALSNGTADAFLWDHQPVTVWSAPTRAMPAVAPAGPEIRQGNIIDVTPVAECEQILPPGMFSQWPLDVLLHITKPFTGLVVLIDLASARRRSSRNESRNESQLQLITGCVAGFLGPNDFGCRTSEDEFVMVCPGPDGAEAQRRLNQISEQLWEFQQSGNGTFSLLFSWGGIGSSGKPLSEAISAAVQRMNRINRNRYISSTESVNHRRKVV